MSETESICVTDLSKDFRLYSRPRDRIIETLTLGRCRRSKLFQALDRVSFALPRGGSLGVIGPNGAGKSTLLRILAGTLHPTSGRVEIAGRIAGLLELGTGFHPDFTGRQNAALNARLLGLDDAAIEAKMPEIAAFAEIGEFLDRPLRIYSSGMKVRLGFAVAASVDPDVLLIDEALAVGDAYFQQKCIRRIREFREHGVSLLFVSHDFTAVRTLCDETILLDGGRVVARGRPDQVLERYNALVAAQVAGRELLRLEEKQAPTTEHTHRAGTFEAIIVSVGLHDARGTPLRATPPGEQIEIRLRIRFLLPVLKPTVGILIRDRLGNDVYGTNTFHQEVDVGEHDTGDEITVSFFLALDLGPGDYTLTAAVHSFDTHLLDCYDWVDRAVVFRVLEPSSRRSIGTALLRPQVAVSAARHGGNSSDLDLELLFGPASASLDLRGKGCVTGWYAPEGEGEDVFRWTTDRFVFLLRSGAGRNLCFETATERPDGTPVRAEVRLGAKRLGEFTVAPGVAFSTFALPISSGWNGNSGCFTVALSDAWCPKETGAGTDLRHLGLRIRRIWLA